MPCVPCNRADMFASKHGQPQSPCPCPLLHLSSLSSLSYLPSPFSLPFLSLPSSLFLSLRLLFFLFPLIFLLLLFSFLFSLPRRWISHHPLQPARRLASGTCATMSDMHNHVGHAANTTMQLATVRDLLRLFSMPCQVNASSAGGLCTSFPGTCLTRSNQ